jgi:hypothetical protein
MLIKRASTLNFGASSKNTRLNDMIGILYEFDMKHEFREE